MSTKYFRHIQTHGLISFIDATVDGYSSELGYDIDISNTYGQHHGFYRWTAPILFDGVITISFKWKPSTVGLGNAGAAVRPYVAVRTAASHNILSQRAEPASYGQIASGSTTRALAVRLSRVAASNAFPLQRSAFGMTSDATSVHSVADIPWIIDPFDYNECVWVIDTINLTQTFTVTSSSGEVSTHTLSFTESGCNISRGANAVFEIGTPNYIQASVLSTPIVESFKHIIVHRDGIKIPPDQLFPSDNFIRVNASADQTFSIEGISQLTRPADIKTKDTITLSGSRVGSVHNRYFAITSLQNPLQQTALVDYTVTVWFRYMRTPAPDFILFSTNGFNSAPSGVRISVVNSNIIVTVRNNSDQLVLFSIPLDNVTWNMLSLTKSGDNYSLFLNGTLYYTTLLDSQPIDVAGYYMEASTNSLYHIKSVKVYNKSVSTFDINAEYNSFKASDDRFSGNYPAVNPYQLDKLNIWYDLSDTTSIVQSGGRVSQLSDKSGNNRHAIQNTGNYRPHYMTYTLDGKTLVYFRYGNTASSSSSAATTLGITNLVSNRAFTFNNTLFMVATTGGLIRLNGIFSGGPAFTVLGQSITVPNTSMYSIISLTARDDQTFTFYVNGIEYGPFPVATIGNNANFNAIISGSTGSQWALAEFLIYNYVIDDIERTKIEAFLAYKWGLVDVLPPNSPYRTQQPF